MATKEHNAPHKVWGGTLSFGLVSIPCALFAAAREEKISFNQLHSKCLGRLKQQPLTCPTCSSLLGPDGIVTVAKDEIVKGYELPDGKFVTVTKAEIEAAEPASSHTLEITEFVAADQVDPIFFESSFYLGVAEGGEKPYALVRDAMQVKGMVALAKLCYSGKEHVAIVRPFGSGLMLHTLFWNYEVRQFSYPNLPEVSDKELTIACQLVDALSSSFDPASFKDNYRANMLTLIEQKKAGETPTVTAIPAKKAPVTDISAALAASITAARAQRAQVTA